MSPYDYCNSICFCEMLFTLLFQVKIARYARVSGRDFVVEASDIGNRCESRLHPSQRRPSSWYVAQCYSSQVWPQVRN